MEEQRLGVLDKCVSVRIEDAHNNFFMDNSKGITVSVCVSYFNEFS